MNKWIPILLVGLSSTTLATSFDTSKAWLDLLFYERRGTGYESLADDQEFFISRDGKTNPKAEHKASLAKAKAQDSDFRKRFPLRYKQLCKAHQLPYKPLVNLNKNIASAMIAFPNRYMASPASMFGHLFIILKSRHGLMDSDIMHFLADTSGTNEYLYLYNGLTGKFKGWFLKEPYYRKIKDYNYVEDRDVIYYDLNLSKQALEDLQLLAIDLKNTHFDYYFLDENCAYFIGKLLNIVLDNIVTRTLPVFPSQIVNNLQDKAYITAESRRLSSTKRFSERFNPMPEKQRKQVLALLLNKKDTIPNDRDTLTTFLTISEYMINNYPMLAPSIRHNRIQAYKTLSQLGASTSVRQQRKSQKLIQKIKSTAISSTYSNLKQLTLRYHPIYYSEDDYLEHRNIKTMNILAPEISMSPEQHPQIGLNLAELENVTETNVVLDAYSWKLHSYIGYQQHRILHRHILEIGKAYRFWGNSMWRTFLGIDASNTDIFSLQQREAFIMRPSFQSTLSNTLVPHILIGSLGYQNRLEEHIIETSLAGKWHNISWDIRYLITNKQNQVSVSAKQRF